MEEQLLGSYPFNTTDKISKIKENVILITRKDGKFILKGKRKEERNILEKLRFQNEKRFYGAFSHNRLRHLNVPEFEIDEQNNLLLEYVEADRSRKIQEKQLIAAYQELQQISPERDLLLDIYNQILRGYIYRVNAVAFQTISKKAGWKRVYKIIRLYYSLNQKQKPLNNKYWVHGDLTLSNYFNDQEGHLYFIDFENMFYTRRWPLAEIFTKCFTYYLNNRLVFDPKLLNLYLEELDKNSEILKTSLYLQCRFGLLFQSIREIAQTKNMVRREKYLDFLDIALNDILFDNWFDKNIKATIN